MGAAYTKRRELTDSKNEGRKEGTLKTSHCLMYRIFKLLFIFEFLKYNIIQYNIYLYIILNL